jgi:hypothetical protein
VFDGLDPIPTRRHAHVDERHGVGKPSALRLANFFECLGSLVGRFHLKGNGDRTGRLAEQQCLIGIQLGGGRRRCENLAKVVVDTRQIIDQEDTQVPLCAHRIAPG